MKTSKGNILRAAGIVSGATFLSRILGFVRDMITAHYLGTSFTADAFFVAFRIPNLLRRLFGEGSLTASFIPVFSSYLAAGKKEEAKEIAQTALTLVAAILVLVTIAGICFSPLIISLIAPGFHDNPEKFQLAVLLNRIMFPYILLISLVALAMGILNSVDHFLAPALAPVLLNICMIGAVFLLSLPLGNPALALAVGVLLGGLAQLALQVPFLRKKGFSLAPKYHFRHPAIGRILKLMGPSLVGLAITQITIFVNTLLASLLMDGSISYLYYADRLVQFPLGVFAVALGTAILPALSRQASKQQWEDFSQTFSLAIRGLFFITLPAMTGLIILSKPIIYVLFQRGNFDATSTAMVAQTMIAYTCGLWAYAALRIVVPVFYSLQDAKTPVKVGGVALIINIVAALALMLPLKHIGLALATAISSAANIIILIYLLAKKKTMPPLKINSITKSLGQAAVATGIMAVVLLALPHCSWFALTYVHQLADAGRLAVMITIGGLAYAGSSLLLGSREMDSLKAMMGKRGTTGT
ncbi:MAG: murein biosynthesis integral membrane protein MurJ [Deltaproteobacteria bacterium]|nr:murein biosynthesis integral membrane protein MurJ [Candidatus Anaeroferrophillus wilburensis]MBN2889660.1 murein biosynthesis integral membrane protein MurJ [Deltaproteobacteria bacterium]